MADFIVVRQHTAPSGRPPSAASLLDFIVVHQRTAPLGKVPSAASLSNFRCQPHQWGDAHYPLLLYTGFALLSMQI